MMNQPLSMSIYASPHLSPPCEMAYFGRCGAQQRLRLWANSSCHRLKSAAQTRRSQEPPPVWPYGPVWPRGGPVEKGPRGCPKRPGRAPGGREGGGGWPLVPSKPDARGGGGVCRWLGRRRKRNCAELRRRKWQFTQLPAGTSWETAAAMPSTPSQLADPASPRPAAFTPLTGAHCRPVLSDSPAPASRRRRVAPPAVLLRTAAPTRRPGPQLGMQRARTCPHCSTWPGEAPHDELPAPEDLPLAVLLPQASSGACVGRVGQRSEKRHRVPPERSVVGVRAVCPWRVAAPS